MSLKIIGHRGARGLAPENTLAAIEAGIKAGADEIEIDARVTKDDIAVVNHDRRVNGALIFMHPLAELQDIKPDLATFKEAIRTVNRRVPLIIEVKGGEPIEPVVKVLKAFLKQGWEVGDFRLGSKSQKTLLALHKALPKIPTVVIERWSGVRASWRARQLGTKFVCMNGLFLWWFFVSSMSKSGYKLTVYMREKPEKLKAWERRGLYGVVTDHPEYFKNKK